MTDRVAALTGEITKGLMEEYYSDLMKARNIADMGDLPPYVRKNPVSRFNDPYIFKGPQ